MKGTINQDSKTLESRANSIRVSAILKKYTMVIALVVVFIFFTALTGGKMLYAQNISNRCCKTLTCWLWAAACCCASSPAATWT